MFSMKKDKKKSDVPEEPKPLTMPDYLSSDPLADFPDPFKNNINDSLTSDAIRAKNHHAMRQAKINQQHIKDMSVSSNLLFGAQAAKPKPSAHLQKQLQINDTWSIQKEYESNSLSETLYVGTNDEEEKIILDPLHIALYRELKESRLALQQVEEGLSNVRTRRKETQISLLLQNDEISDDVL